MYIMHTGETMVTLTVRALIGIAAIWKSASGTYTLGRRPYATVEILRRPLPCLRGRRFLPGYCVMDFSGQIVIDLNEPVYSILSLQECFGIVIGSERLLVRSTSFRQR